MTFEAWLKKQKHRDDPVGDLAQDFIGFCKFNNLKRVECNRDHLLRNKACRGAFSALAQAKNEYRKILWLDRLIKKPLTYKHKDFISVFAKYLRTLNLENGKYYRFSVNILQTGKLKDLTFIGESLVPTTAKEIWG